MTIYRDARFRAIKNGHNLSDRRSLYYDGIDISINILIKMETDEYYIPHPNNSAKLILYYQDAVLSTDICRVCPITRTKQELKFMNNDSSISSSNVHSQYNHSFTIKSRRIKRELRSKNKQKTFYYFARLHAALMNHALSNIYNVQLLTGYSSKVLSQVENNKSYIPQIDVSNNLLKLYKCSDLARKICNNCPVQHAHNYLKNKDILSKGGI